MSYGEPGSFVEWAYVTTSKAIDRVLPEGVARWANDRVLLKLFGMKNNEKLLKVKVEKGLLSSAGRVRQVQWELEQRQINEEYGPAAMDRKAVEKYESIK